MYNILGASVFLTLAYKWPSLCFYFIATFGLAGATIAWYEHNVAWWFVSLGVTFISATIASSVDLFANQLLQKSPEYMREMTPCCLPCVGCTNSRRVLGWTCFGRFLAGLSATISCYISWTFRATFWEDAVVVQMTWTVTTVLWIMSLIPYFICLIQCAEEKLKTDMVVNRKLYHFRKYVAMWLIHDLVLGLFWLYLSLTLHHLLKEDDSEWRTIFLSMISWHIIVFVIRELYFSDVWSTATHVSCCAEETRSRWGDISSLVGMATVYGVLVHVVRDSVDMGCSIEHVILIILALLFAWCGKLLSSIAKPVQQQDKKHTTTPLKLDKLDF